jgi:hypothetical protein
VKATAVPPVPGNAVGRLQIPAACFNSLWSGRLTDGSAGVSDPGRTGEASGYVRQEARERRETARGPARCRGSEQLGWLATALQTSMARVSLWSRVSSAGRDRRTDKSIGAAAKILSRFPLPKRGGGSTGQSPGVGLQSTHVKNRWSRAENSPYSHPNGRRPTQALRLGKVQRWRIPMSTGRPRKSKPTGSGSFTSACKPTSTKCLPHRNTLRRQFWPI